MFRYLAIALQNYAQCMPRNDLRVFSTTYEKSSFRFCRPVHYHFATAPNYIGNSPNKSLSMFGAVLLGYAEIVPRQKNSNLWFCNIL